MTNSEILEFLENSQVQLQTQIDEKFAQLQPKYKPNYWLKKSGLTITQRVLMQLLADEGCPLSYTQLIAMTGLCRKAIRENMYGLADMGYVARGERQGIWKKTV